MSKLALFGGPKIRTELFPFFSPIDNNELEHIKKVFNSKIFSQYLGTWHANFYGGPEVRDLEQKWAEFFNVKHAVSVNSATSALYCAVGAIGTEPFDEIIVSPYTMSASATAPLIYNAIPVFADIEKDYFCLDVKSIESKITEKTKAIIVVDIFGQPYDADKINALAKKYNLKIIEDCAQAPYAKLHGHFAGTLGDIGIYSLNYHKHIHCGEGGILVTNDDELADRLRLIRNHAEAVVENKGETNLTNMIGFNYRMTELEAAIANSQLGKLPAIVERYQENADYLKEKLNEIPFLTCPKVRNGATHSYYSFSITFNQNLAGIHRNIFANAVREELMPMAKRESEGVLVGTGYVKPLYLAPLFQTKTAYGSQGFPWSMTNKEYSYEKGLCPVTEECHYNSLLSIGYLHPNMKKSDLDDIINAFYKVSENIHELRK